MNSNILIGFVIGQLIVLQVTLTLSLSELRRIGENTHISRTQARP